MKSTVTINVHYNQTSRPSTKAIHYTHACTHSIRLNDGERNLYSVGRLGMNEDEAELCQSCSRVPNTNLTSAAFRMWHKEKERERMPVKTSEKRVLFVQHAYCTTCSLTHSLTCSGASGSCGACTKAGGHQSWSGASVLARVRQCARVRAGECVCV